VTYLRRNQQVRGVGKAATSRGIRLIAFFKLFKALVLFAVGIGALNLLHQDLAVLVEHWIDVFRVDPNNYFIQRLLERFSILDAHKLKQLSVGTFFYSALLLTEGIGLLLAKRWAEYFTIIATSSFIPFELYELTRRVTAGRLVVLSINVAVVVYLVFELRRNRQAPQE
jgi:uncharacterized membrane protein (DUF2068 family)